MIGTRVNAYGALEMKTKYQRNMLLGNLSVVVLVSLLISGLYICDAIISGGIEVEPFEKESIYQIIDFPPPQSYQTETAQPGGGSIVQKLSEFLSSNIMLVDDDEMIDEEFVFPTQIDKSYMVDNQFGDGPPGDGRNIIIEVPPEIPEYPKLEEFHEYQVLPTMIYSAAPEYPRLAKMAGLEGAVWVAVLVGKNGSVVEAKIYTESGVRAGFEQAALAAALKCRYSPAVQNGYNVAAWVMYKVEFTLNE